MDKKSIQNRSDDSLSDLAGRDAILAMLAAGMTDLNARIAAADPETPDEEALHLKRVRTLGYLANQHRKLQRDRDLEALTEELELLQAEGLGQ